MLKEAPGSAGAPNHDLDPDREPRGEWPGTDEPQPRVPGERRGSPAPTAGMWRLPPPSPASSFAGAPDAAPGHRGSGTAGRAAPRAFPARRQGARCERPDDEGTEDRAHRAAVPAAARRRLGAAGEGPAVRVGQHPEGGDRQASCHACVGAARSEGRRDRHGRAVGGAVARRGSAPTVAPRPRTSSTRRRSSSRRGNETCPRSAFRNLASRGACRIVA